MKQILCAVAILAFVNAKAQVTTDSTIKLDLLKAPTYPAFNILGISLNDIERPTDLNAFALSVQNATNNFTSIPNSYAINIAPFLLGKRKYELRSFDANTHTIPQSFVLSLGFTHVGPKGKENVDSLKTTKLGIGIKFSIVRPHWKQKTKQLYANAFRRQADFMKEARKMRDAAFEKESDSLEALMVKAELSRNAAELKRVQNVLAAREAHYDTFLTVQRSAAYEDLKRAATAFKPERQGFFLDFTSGFAMDFEGNKFNASRIYRGGAWLTGGYEHGDNGWSFLSIIRYLYNPETVFADSTGLIKSDNISTLDAGVKILLDGTIDHLTLNAEGIYRSVLNKNVIDPSWRLVINAEYDLGKNRKLTFAFGRDFDGTISKGGNLIAALNFITGLGGDRKLAAD
jgi:hypothetical protein